MAKEKLSLGEFKVQSFVTTLGEEQMNQVKGGFAAISGRRYAYRTRWTLVEVLPIPDVAGNTPTR